MSREDLLRTALTNAHNALRKARSMAKDIPNARLRDFCAQAAGEARLALNSTGLPKDYSMNTKCECGHTFKVHRLLNRPGAGECLHGQGFLSHRPCKKCCGAFRPAKKGKK